MTTRIKVPNLLCDAYMWSDMLTNLHREKFPHMDMVKLGEDDYEIRFSLAGYSKEDIEVLKDKNVLRVNGDWPVQSVEYLMHGIAKRKFHREIPLEENIKIKDVKMENGILTISLVREVPESEKPKKFKIS